MVCSTSAPVYVRTPQAFPVAVELPNQETILLFGSQVVYASYYRAYGVQPYMLPPSLWLYISVFLSHANVVNLESTCHCMCEMLQDEECWRLFCVNWLDERKVVLAGRLSLGESNSSSSDGKAGSMERGPASAMSEEEIHCLSFVWSWRQTAQQMVWGTDMNHDLEDFNLLAKKELDQSEMSRPDVMLTSSLPASSSFPTHSFRTARISNNTASAKPLLIRDKKTLFESFFQGGWTLASLLREFGDERWNVLLRIGVTCEFSMSLTNFVAYMRVTADRVPLYLFESRLPEALQKRIELPRIFEDNLLTELNDPAFQGRQWLLIGGVGSGLSFHVDPFGCSAWNALLEGKKRWALYPPSRIPPGVTTRTIAEQWCMIHLHLLRGLMRSRLRKV